MIEAAKYSFDLNEEMIRLLGEEFDVQKLIARFAEAMRGKKGDEVEVVGKQVFEQYGRDWMKRTIELSEMYPDRTYDVMREAADKTGELTFPYVPQRSIEIAYLSTKGIFKMDILENHRGRLVYRMPNCTTHAALAKECGEEVAKLLPCKSACLAACETLKQELDMDFDITMENSMPADGYCQFALGRVVT